MTTRCLHCMREYDSVNQSCPYCGYAGGAQPEEVVHIVPGTMLKGRFIIGTAIGHGGFGITYIGWDTILEQRVAIKEYFPSEFSTRMPGVPTVMVFEGEKKEQFDAGKNKFLEEARHLAKFQNEPGVVRVFDVFEENETAYIIMEFLEGQTLKKILERDGRIGEDEAVRLLLPVMKSLEAVHEEGLLHRDIAPDNIFITNDGESKLIDFGASRYATTSHSRSITVIIKPGYSPEEQYRSRGDQGPHTDVYALAATLYRMITGQTPPDAMERRSLIEKKNRDPLKPLHKYDKKISQVRENAILNALNAAIEDRTPTVRRFMEDLSSEKPVARVYGNIKRTDFFRIPLWVLIAVPLAIAGAITFTILVNQGIITFGPKGGDSAAPKGVVTVPEVEGFTVAEAIKSIETSGLLAVTNGSVVSDYISAGLIVLQSPAGGSYLEEQGRVLLTVSSGREASAPVNGISTVPYIIWEEEQLAVETLAVAGLKAEISYEYDDNVAEGQVISQSIAAGEVLDEGSSIEIVVSKGAKPFELPDVVGKDEEEATEILRNAGLAVTVEYRSDDTHEENEVISQNIDAGTLVKRGESVILTVSTGAEVIEVPDVVSKNYEDAELILQKAGFKVARVDGENEQYGNNTVYSQTPSAGTGLKKGDTVTLWVSSNLKNVLLQVKETITMDVPEEETPPSESVMKFFYNNAGELSGMSAVSEDQKCTNYVAFEYQDGLMKKATFYNSNGRLYGTTEREYDEDGKIRKITENGYPYPLPFMVGPDGAEHFSLESMMVNNVLSMNEETYETLVEYLKGTITHEYSYDDRNRIAFIQNKNNGNDTTRSEYTYGEDGLTVIEKVTKGEQTSRTVTTVFTADGKPAKGQEERESATITDTYEYEKGSLVRIKGSAVYIEEYQDLNYTYENRYESTYGAFDPGQEVLPAYKGE